MRIADAIRTVLQQANAPLHYKEITRRITDEGLCRFEATDPSVSVAAQLSTLSREEPHVLRRVSPGVYECSERSKQSATLQAPGSQDEDPFYKRDISVLPPRLRKLFDPAHTDPDDTGGFANLYENVVLYDLGEPFTPDNEFGGWEEGSKLGYVDLADNLQPSMCEMFFDLYVDDLADIAEYADDKRFADYLDYVRVNIVRDWLEHRYELPFELLTDIVDCDSYRAAEMVLAAARTIIEAEGRTETNNVVERAIKGAAKSFESAARDSEPELRVSMEEHRRDLYVLKLLSAGGGPMGEVLAQCIRARAREIGLFTDPNRLPPLEEITRCYEDVEE